jgi:hypothetical protein
MNDEKYMIGSGSFRLLIGDLYDLYCYHFSLTRRLAEAADEKALLKIQKSVSGYERRMKRLCRRWGLVKLSVLHAGRFENTIQDQRHGHGQYTFEE